ncbi:MAG TPA: methyltransferase domain-containing protein [Tepidisphaeraceae bacterium]
MKERRPHSKKHHHRKPPPAPRNPGVIRKPGGPPPAGAAAGQEPAPTHWGDVAEWYDQLVGEEGSEYHRHVVLPGAVRLLAAKAGDQVLDIACGQGVLCRMLARQGVQASGVDAAVNLIRLANDRNAQIPPGTARPVYRVGDVRELSPAFGEDHFDAAACLLAIQNINPIGPVFESVARVLKPMGRFVVVMMHPAFRGPKETSWRWDDKRKVQYRRVDRYLLPRKIPIVTHPGKSQDYTWTFHKPIEAYVKAARNAGLLIDALEEWTSHKTSTSGPRAPAENVAREEIPLFLAIRAVKISPPTVSEAPDVPATAEQGVSGDAGDRNPPETQGPG